MKNKNNKSERLEHWLSKFDPDERPEIRELWEQAQEADKADDILISGEEKSRTLAAIKAECNLDRGEPASQSAGGNRKNHRAKCGSGLWTWYAGAATILLAAGISYLLIPVEVTVPRGETVSISLPDQSVATLNSGSVVGYNRLFGYTNRRVHLEGEAYFEVQNGELPFTVTTFNASIEVLGTKFNIRSWPGEPNPETSVSLTEGRLQFQALKGGAAPVILNPGEKSTVRTRDDTPVPPDTASIEESLAWLNNRFVFENRPLYRIIPELERRFNINISVRDPGILQDTLTIYYSGHVTPEQIINDISLSKGLHYRAVNNGFVLEN
ncbi:MAG: FecR domain-containing protein [Balneolaceae bacterium]|nr:FecR domain-containing protein [Balneolaceae bacterium]